MENLFRRENALTVRSAWKLAMWRGCGEFVHEKNIMSISILLHWQSRERVPGTVWGLFCWLMKVRETCIDFKHEIWNTANINTHFVRFLVSTQHKLYKPIDFLLCRARWRSPSFSMAIGGVWGEVEEKVQEKTRRGCKEVKSYREKQKFCFQYQTIVRLGERGGADRVYEYLWSKKFPGSSSLFLFVLDEWFQRIFCSLNDRESFQWELQKKFQFICNWNSFFAIKNFHSNFSFSITNRALSRFRQSS